MLGNDATNIARSAIKQRATEVADRLMEVALRGNVLALRLWLDAILAVGPLVPELPHAGKDAKRNAIAGLMAAAATGAVTLEEAHSVADLIEDDTART
jgi:hypothetical protein